MDSSCRGLLFSVLTVRSQVTSRAQPLLTLRTPAGALPIPQPTRINTRELIRVIPAAPVKLHTVCRWRDSGDGIEVVAAVWDTRFGRLCPRALSGTRSRSPRGSGGVLGATSRSSRVGGNSPRSRSASAPSDRSAGTHISRYTRERGLDGAEPAVPCGGFRLHGSRVGGSFPRRKRKTCLSDRGGASREGGARRCSRGNISSSELASCFRRRSILRTSCWEPSLGFRRPTRASSRPRRLRCPPPCVRL